MTKNIQEHGYGGYLSDADVKIYSTAGESYSKTAYMLVYEKKLKSELRQIVEEEKEEGKEEGKAEGEEEEKIEKVGFNSVRKEIP